MDLYLEAAELGGEERARFVAASCGDDLDLRRRVGELLATAADGFDLVAAARRAERELLADRERTPRPTDSTTDEVDPPTGEGLPEVEGYQPIRELGRGGMGVVYLMRAVPLHRFVALKVVSDVGRDLEERLRAEMQVMAQLQHPNIVPVLGHGRTVAGRPYYTMPVLRGKRLSDIISEIKASDPATVTTYPLGRRLQIFVQIAQAVAYAHDQSVLHRDLKPANVMLGAHGEVQVLDWGLAKIVGLKEQPTGPHRVVTDAVHGMTQSGELIGTVAYMPPEQVRGDPECYTTASDVYSLGAILYELVVLSPPVDASEPAGALRTILTGRITPPSERVGSEQCPRALEAVIRRAMAPQPTERYESAQELADDVATYRDGRPVTVLDYGLLALVSLWARRHRGITAVVLGATLVLAVVLSLSAFRLRQETAAARDARDVADLRREEAEERLAWTRYSEATALAESGRLLDAAAVLDELEADNPRDAVSPLAIAASRWLLLTEGVDSELLTLTGHTDRVVEVAFLPGDDQVISAGRDGTLRVWDVATGVELRAIEGDGAPFQSMTLTPDGRRALVGTENGAIHLFDTITGAELWRRELHDLPVIGSAISPDGKTAVTRSVRSTDLDLWEVETGSSLGSLHGPDGLTHDVDCYMPTFSPDGRVVAAGCNDGRLRRGLLVLFPLDHSSSPRVIEAHSDAIRYVAFEPNGRSIITGAEDRELKRWDAKTGELLRTYIGHSRGIKAATLTADGRQILSGSFDRTLRIWDVATGEQLRRLDGHREQVDGITVSRDGRFAITASWDGTLKLWLVATAPTEARRSIRKASAGDSLVFAFSPDGRVLLTAHRARVEAWDVGTGRRLVAFPERGSWVRSLAFADGGRLALSGAEDGSTRVWDMISGDEVETLCVHEGGVRVVSSAGGLLLTGDGTRVVTWDPRTWVELDVWSPSAVVTELLGIDEQGNVLVASEYGAGRRNIELADRGSGAVLWSHASDRATLSPDGRLALLGTNVGGEASVIDTTTGQVLSTHKGAGWSVSSAAFSPDGRDVVFLNGYGVSLIDTRAGREARTIITTGLGSMLAFHPTEPLIVGHDDGLRIWDLGYPARLRRWRGTVAKAQATLSVRFDDPEASATIGEFYADRDVNDRALELLERALRSGHSVPPALLGRLHWQLERTSVAASWYGKALAQASEEDRLYLEIVSAATRRQSGSQGPTRPPQSTPLTR